MPQAYRLLIFDWDGTLSDSTAQIVEGVQAAFAAHRLPPPDEADIRHIIGLSLNEALQQLRPDLTAPQAEAVMTSYRRHYFSYSTVARLFQDAPGVLAQLQPHYWLAVATNKGRQGLEMAMAQTGSAGFFLTTRTVDECAAKPQPEMVLSICEELGVPVQQALVIGDTTHDLNMAYNAGCHAVAVTTGAHNTSQLLSAPHRILLGSLTELADWLNPAASRPSTHPDPS